LWFVSEVKLPNTITSSGAEFSAAKSFAGAAANKIAAKIAGDKFVFMMLQAKLDSVN
jgi:hypothetical protein